MDRFRVCLLGCQRPLQLLHRRCTTNEESSEGCDSAGESATFESVSDPHAFWDLVDETAVWVGADGEPETFPVAVLDGCKGRTLPEIVSIVELGVQIGEVVTIDGKPLAPGSNIHLTVNGMDRRRRHAELGPAEPPRAGEVDDGNAWIGTGRTEGFAALVEGELRVRRDRDVGRCAWCGNSIDSADDYVHVNDRLIHSACTDRPSGQVAELQPHGKSR
jgi:hypothetical protein